MTKMTINTDTAESNFAELLKTNKTYFLNGAWGTGKTEFLKKAVKKVDEKKVIELKLWEYKNSQTIFNRAFDAFLGKLMWVFKGFILTCVTLTILQLNFFDTDITRYLKNEFQILGFLITVIAVTVSVFKFVSFKSDSLYGSFFNIKFLTKNKILIIDDFDRINKNDQHEVYKLFNILRHKLPIVFVGDFNKLCDEDSQFLRKIVDRYVDLPLSVMPTNIWNEYFNKVEKELCFKIYVGLRNLFIIEKRNLRDQVLFDDYMTMEFQDKNKRGRVQVNQQILIIYLFLFKRDYYDKLYSGWEPEYKRPPGNYYDNERIFNSEIEKLIFGILFKEDGYPLPFYLEKEAYYIFSNVSNLSVDEAYKIINDEKKLKNMLITNSTNSDFYSFVAKKYKEWDISSMEMFIHKQKNEQITVASEIKILESLSFELLKSDYIRPLQKFVIDKFIVRNSPSMIDNRDNKDDSLIASRINNLYSPLIVDLDISQKLFFFIHFRLINIKYLRVIYRKEIDSTLSSKDYYTKVRKKPYLLVMNVMEDDTVRTSSSSWPKGTLSKVNELSDSDFLEFFLCFNLIKIESIKTPLNFPIDWTKINSINLYASYNPPEGIGEEPINFIKKYNLEFVLDRLDIISKKLDIKIIKK